jgi:glutathione synthase/RimK-type ligase-like ATP-grasp enzyme
MGSGGAKALSTALGCRRIYNDERSRWRYKDGDVVINWGLSVIPRLTPARRHEAGVVRIINNPSAVAIACNKLKTYQAFEQADVPTCDFTTSYDRASEWYRETGIVFSRKLLNASQGAGIVINDAAEDNGGVIEAPLYTLYFPAKREYRIHVVDGKIIRAVKKGKRMDREEDPNPYIRSHNNGWVFMEEGVEVPPEVNEAAIAAVKALGLDFGAVDVGYNSRLPQPVCCYEVNCAPGFEAGTITCTKYAEAFKEMLSLD